MKGVRDSNYAGPTPRLLEDLVVSSMKDSIGVILETYTYVFRFPNSI